jgi:hypothetical protein
MLAAKANGTTEDDEEPAWSGIIHKDETPVDRVLRIIPGTVVH